MTTVILSYYFWFTKKWEKWEATFRIPCGGVSSQKRPNIYGPGYVIFYLDGKPAAEMRTVSRIPHARSCCMVLRGSNLK